MRWLRASFTIVYYVHETFISIWHELTLLQYKFPRPNAHYVKFFDSLNWIRYLESRKFDNSSRRPWIRSGNPKWGQFYLSNQTSQKFNELEKCCPTNNYRIQTISTHESESSTLCPNSWFIFTVFHKSILHKNRLAYLYQFSNQRAQQSNDYIQFGICEV